MKVRVSDPSLIVATTKTKDPETGKSVPTKEERVRFTVSLVDDDGEALWTQQGFSINRRRKILVPMSRTRFGGHSMQFTHLSPRFEAQLREALLSIPDVIESLGPEPDELEFPRLPEAKRLRGSAVALEEKEQGQ